MQTTPVSTINYKTVGIIGFILSACALLFCICPPASYLLALGALGLGIWALVGKENGLGVASVSLSVIALVLTTVVTIMWMLTISGDLLCTRCGGQGKVDCTYCVAGRLQNGATCPYCNGTGDVKCPQCGGVGAVFKSNSNIAK